MFGCNLFILCQKTQSLGLVKSSKTIPIFSNLTARKFLHSTSIRCKNHYDLLGLKQDATQSQIKAAYYEKAKDLHPDTGKSADPSAFHELSQAYEILGDVNSRLEYDRTLRLNDIPGSSYFTGGTNFTSAEHYEFARRPKQSNPNRQANGPSSDKPGEAFSMSHIQFVYKTLNRSGEEPPPFRPFAEHEFPNTKFNRYEFGRRWDPERRTWVYTQKPRTERMKYQRFMNSKNKDLNYLVGVFMLIVTSTSLYGMLGDDAKFLPKPKKPNLEGYILPEDVLQYTNRPTK